MGDKVFVDSNILLYARDSSEPSKQPVALAYLKKLWESRDGRISVQVLNEFFVNATRKLKPGLTEPEAWEAVDALMAWDPLPLDATLLERTYQTCRQYQLSWWDAMIVAAADACECDAILSEDLSAGQKYHGMTVVNPFQSSLA